MKKKKKIKNCPDSLNIYTTRENDYRKRKILEALEIKKQNTTKR